MKYYIYSRKSVFTGKGESIENQVELCKQYIVANFPGSQEGDITVYEDEGFSGKILQRPQFQKMMRELKASRPDCLVCYRLDRISRNVGDFAALIEELNGRGVAFICIREKFDTSTPMGKAMMYIASVFAQLERETIAERVRDNMLLLAKLGRWLGGTTPTGYTSKKVQEMIIDGKIKSSCQLQEHPDESRLVRTIFEKFLELHSLNGVRKYLHNKGITSRSGKEYSLLGLREILQNPVYCIADEGVRAYFLKKQAEVCFEPWECGEGRGLLSYNKRDYTKGHAPRNGMDKWIIALGRHKGMVSGSDWLSVQHILEQNRPDQAHSNTYNGYALLSGLVICEKCGRRMFSKLRSGRGGQYDYICQGKLQLGKNTCDSRNLPGVQADQAVCHGIRPYVHPDGSLSGYLREWKQELTAQHREDASQALRQKLKETQQEIDHLVLVLGQQIPSATLIQRVTQRMEVLEAEAARLELALKQAQAGTAGSWATEAISDTLRTALLSWEESFEQMNVVEKRTILRILLQKCQWDGETLHLYLYQNREEIG